MVTTAILFRSFFFSVGWDFFFFVLACAGIARVCFLRHRVPVIYTYVCNTHQKKKMKADQSGAGPKKLVPTIIDDDASPPFVDA